MGGRAFANQNPPLPTPRLQPAQYFQARDYLVSQLRERYTRVAVPIEAPEKDHYGDLDLLVCGPKFSIDHRAGDREADAVLTGSSKNPDGDFELHLLVLENLLSPEARFQHSFAVPAKRFPCLCAESFYVQVDINVLSSEVFDWYLFSQSHGDFFQILGPSLRKAGLVLTDTGFYAIHPRIKPRNKKKARVFLTNRPDEVLRFLELDPATFWGTGRHPANSSHVPFANEQELFDFAASMRFFNPVAHTSNEEKSRDRQRVQKRDAFRRFQTEYLPLHYPDLFPTSAATSQSDASELATCSLDKPALDETQGMTPAILKALDFFSKGKEWDAHEREWDQGCKELAERQARRQAKAELHRDIAAYANAWISWLGGSGDVGTNAIGG